MRGGLFSAPELGTPVLESFGPPPDRFLPKEIVSAWESGNPHYPKRDSSTPAQKAGLAYQKWVVKFVESGDCSSFKVRPGIWYCYHDGECRRYCQPDILLQDDSSKTLVIVEVKLRWTADAWWQVQRLYTPVLRRVFGPDWTLIPLVIAKSYDPAVRIVESVKLCDDVFDVSPSLFNVMVVR